MKPLLCIVVAAAMLTGCASNSPTASKRADATFAAPIGKVRLAITKHMVNDGWTPAGADESQLLFEKAGSAGANFWFTNLATGQKPRIMARFSMADLGDERRVFLNAWMIHQPGLGGESRMEMDMVPQLQNVLNKIRSDADGTPFVPVPVPPVKPLGVQRR